MAAISHSKTDLTKVHKRWYTASKNPEVVHFDRAMYLSIEGKGDPSGAEYANDLQALYTVAYALKFKYKSMQQDFVVAKLEGQWSFDEERFGKPDMHQAPLVIPRSEWNYRSLIRLPEFVEKSMLANVIEEVQIKKQLREADRVKWYELPESDFVQILHNGPFDKEPESLQKIKELIDQKGFSQNGLHHEIYLSDFRKTPSEKLKTILREPVK